MQYYVLYIYKPHRIKPTKKIQIKFVIHINYVR